MGTAHWFKLVFISALLALAVLFSPKTAAAALTKVSFHELDIKLDLKKQTVSGTDRLTFKTKRKELRLLLRNGSEIKEALYGETPLQFETREVPGSQVRMYVIPLPDVDDEEKPGDIEKTEEEKQVFIRFEGSFRSIKDARESDIKRGVAYVEDGLMGEEGAFLPSNAYWFPQEDSALTAFDAAVHAPFGYTSIMAGKWLANQWTGTSSNDRWRSDKPVEGIDLVCGKYMIEKAALGGIDIYTFFFEKDQALSETYINKTGEYIKAYSELIAPYPFEKFAVVESFLPTGYGMPSFTLLGSAVIRLPFIPDTSLAHEIAHNWWGNSVFIDNSFGNWAEALTSYTADLRQAKAKGPEKEREFRLSNLRSYKSFAVQSRLALEDFIDASTPESRAVGYNKGTMVFNMLEHILGEEAFRNGLRKFYSQNAFEKATWRDIGAAFQSVADIDLAWFFDQWLLRPGGPQIDLKQTELVMDGEDFVASFKLEQKGHPYRLVLPLKFKLVDGKIVEKNILVSRKVEALRIALPLRPVSVDIDPDYQNFRILMDEEMPPVLGKIFGDKDSLLVLPAETEYRKKYLPIAESISKDFDMKVVNESDLKKNEIGSRSLFIFGGPGENGLFWQFRPHLSNHATFGRGVFVINGERYSEEESALAITIRNPKAKGKVVSFFMGPEEGAKERGAKLRHFSEMSYLIFSGEDIKKGIFSDHSPLTFQFAETPKIKFEPTPQEMDYFYDNSFHR